MIGFYFKKSNTKNRIKYPQKFDNDILNESLGENIQILFLGSSSGDIYYSKNKNNSMLILSGYITEAKFMQSKILQNNITEILLRRFDENCTLEFIKKTIKDLNGSFSILYANVLKDIVICVSDKISSRPQWYYHDDDLIISSNANLIKNQINGLNYDLGMLGSFMLYGFPMQPQKTIYSGIKAIDSATILKFNHKKEIRAEKWYNFRFRDEKISEHDLLEVVTRGLQNSAERIGNTGKKFLLFLSGGVDSRLAAATFKSVGIDPLFITLSDSHNLEVKIASSVAKKLKSTHKIILRDPHWYLRDLPSLVFEMNGTFLWTHGHFSQAYRKLQNEYDLDGAILGDFLEAFSKLFINNNINYKRIWKAQEFAKNVDSLLPKSYQPWGRENTLNLFKSNIRETIVQSLEEDIRRRYEQINEVSSDFKLITDYFFRWQTAATLPTFSMFFDIRSAGPERNLMFDNENIGLLEFLPAFIRNQTGFGVKLIQKLYPQAGNVINANSLLPLRFPKSLHSFAKKVKPYVGKFRRKFIENSHSTVEGWAKKSWLYANDKKWNSFCTKILEDKTLFNEDVFDHLAIQESWNSFNKGDTSKTYDIERLIQIGLLSHKMNNVDSLDS